MTSQADVALGVVVRAHGITGELKVHAYNDASELLGTLRGFGLRAKDGTVTQVEVVRAKRIPKLWIVRLAGVDTREAAEALRGLEVVVPRAALPELPDDEVYLTDLIGCEVWDGERRVGVVESVQEYPTADCLVVVDGDTVRELPMVDTFVEGVDLEARRVHASGTDELPVEARKAR